MRKSSSYIIGLIVVVIIVVGAYAIFHKSPKSSSNTTSYSNSTQPATTPKSTTTTAAVNNAVVLTKSNSSVGQYLTDPSGDALYTFGGDKSGVSNCTGSCLANWPAYQDKGATTGLPANIGTIKRSDNGEVQYTYKGLPLYTFVNDSPGEVTGNGVANFQVAKP